MIIVFLSTLDGSTLDGITEILIAFDYQKVS